MKSLKKVYYEKLNEANKLGLIQFIFYHDGNFYLAVFDNAIWTDPPVKIKML